MCDGTFKIVHNVKSANLTLYQWFIFLYMNANSGKAKHIWSNKFLSNMILLLAVFLLTRGFQYENSAFSSWDRLFRNVYLGFNRKFNIRASAGFFLLEPIFQPVPDIPGLFYQCAVDIFSVVNSPQSPVFYRIICCYSL